MNPRRFALLTIAVLCVTHSSWAATNGPTRYNLFAQTNLFAWCIVPFDAKHRGPEERAAMLERLGFRMFAYDYRAQHIPTFDAEVEALERHGIRLLAWWFPTSLNPEAQKILDVLERHQLKAQLWVMGGGEPTTSPEQQLERVKAETERIRTIAEAAARIGCGVGLYNHGGWFGEPENQIAIINSLRGMGITNVGIVYNLHHGHAHVKRFAAVLDLIKPWLLAINLNGIGTDAETAGSQILPLGQGELDLDLLRIIQHSGWQGPIGILNHTGEDAEARLRENLQGLRRLAAQFDGNQSPKALPRR